MAAKNGKHPATSLGRTMHRDRLAHGWTLRELSTRTKTHVGTLSQVENGVRPMTENLAMACDECFPERRGWYLQYYEESKDWMPAGFRDWSEYEDHARELIVWAPGIVDGLAQTEDYARELLDIYPGVTADMIETRLKSRMARQQRILREGGAAVVLLVDMAALYRGVGSSSVMAAQCAKLAEVSKLETVTLQVVPPVKIPLATALVVVADDAAYTEHGLGGAVFTDDESATKLRRLIGTVRGEARPVSESLALIRKAERSWTGASRHSAATAERRA